MERNFAYAGAIPLDTDLLSTEKNAYIAISKLAAAILGTNTLLNGFSCTPTSPASMNINVGPGEIYSLEEVDPTAYGDLPPDTTNLIMKQGINLNTTQLAITAPGTSGYSQNYLIQFQFTQEDIDPVVLAYYNPTNPGSPYSGPNNSGTANETVRSNFANIQALAGTAAPSGTQTTPSPSAGYVGGWVVTVANGQTTITSGNISLYSTAPFISETLLQKISQITADARYAQITQVQSGQFLYAVDSSVTPNTIIATLSPAITSYIAGQTYYVKIANTNTGPSTVNFNGVGTVNIKLGGGSSLVGGELAVNSIAELIFDGTNFQIANPRKGAFLGIRAITSSGTYVPTPGCVNAKIRAWGAGGGGGCTTTNPNTGGSGGAGAYVEAFVPINGNVTVTIPTGGAGAATNTTNNGGAASGDTSFGSLVIAKSGSPGSGGTVGGLGGLGGQASACTFPAGGFAMNGGNGNSSTTIATSGFQELGLGGSSPFNVPASYITVPPDGLANSGQGGGGGTTTNHAGSGGSGLIIVDEYS